MTIEADPEIARYATGELAAAKLADQVELLVSKSLDVVPPKRLDLALFDSVVPIRTKEFEHFYQSVAQGATVIFHDTALQHPGLADEIRSLIEQGKLTGTFFPTPRGIFVGHTGEIPAFSSELARARAHVERLLAERDGLQSEIAALHRSSSWRITAPLRNVAQMFKALSPGYLRKRRSSSRLASTHCRHGPG